MTRRRNIREIWCGVVTRRVGESYRIHMRVGSGIEDFRNTPCDKSKIDMSSFSLTRFNDLMQ